MDRLVTRDEILVLADFLEENQLVKLGPLNMLRRLTLEERLPFPNRLASLLLNRVQRRKIISERILWVAKEMNQPLQTALGLWLPPMTGLAEEAATLQLHHDDTTYGHTPNTAYEVMHAMECCSRKIRLALRDDGLHRVGRHSSRYLMQSADYMLRGEQCWVPFEYLEYAYAHFRNDFPGDPLKFGLSEIRHILRQDIMQTAWTHYGGSY